MPRLLPRAALAALALPLVVIVGFQSAWAALACVEVEMRDARCCKPAHRQTPDRAPHLAAPSCCDMTATERPAAPIAVVNDQGAAIDLPNVARVVTVVAAPQVRCISASAPLARPPPRVPLFLANHAILR